MNRGAVVIGLAGDGIELIRDHDVITVFMDPVGIGDGEGGVCGADKVGAIKLPLISECSRADGRDTEADVLARFNRSSVHGLLGNGEIREETLIHSQHHPEARGFASVGRTNQCPVGGPGEPGVAAEVAAANDAIRACCGSGRIGHGPFRISPVLIQAPLPDIAMHIKQAPVIWPAFVSLIGQAGPGVHSSLVILWGRHDQGIPLDGELDPEPPLSKMARPAQKEAAKAGALHFA